MEIRDICITGIPNVRNFQHEFTNCIRARFGRDGYLVNNCYLNDNKRQFTQAFVRLKDPTSKLLTTIPEWDSLWKLKAKAINWNLGGGQ